jgi:beta-phosphoglucomutase-like phosphatase (HAD superfamily)
MLTSLQSRYGFPLAPEEIEAYVRREEDAVIERLQAEARVCAGADAALARLAERGYKLAVVSSSAFRRVKASVEKVRIAHHFVNGAAETGSEEGHAIFSAATSLPVPTSKPDPAIYLHAVERLGKKAEECVAVEDSRSGTLSAARAGLKVVGYVGPYEEGEEREKMVAALKEAGATVVMEHWSEFDECLAKVERGEA